MVAVAAAVGMVAEDSARVMEVKWVVTEAAVEAAARVMGT